MNEDAAVAVLGGGTDARVSNMRRGQEHQGDAGRNHRTAVGKLHKDAPPGLRAFSGLEIHMPP
jgi:hypothetical protein